MKDAATRQALLEKIASLENKNASLQEDLKRKEEYIAYLERCLYSSKRDRKVKPSCDGPTLFDDFFE